MRRHKREVLKRKIKNNRKVLVNEMKPKTNTESKESKILDIISKNRKCFIDVKGEEVVTKVEKSIKDAFKIKREDENESSEKQFTNHLEYVTKPLIKIIHLFLTLHPNIKLVDTTDGRIVYAFVENDESTSSHVGMEISNFFKGFGEHFADATKELFVKKREASGQENGEN